MAQQKVSAAKVTQRVKEGAEQVTTHPWFAQLARFGYGAKGIVYLVAGVLSARAAFGLGGATTDSRGALLTILSQPFGKFLLVLIGVGLIGYVLLRLVQALMDPEKKGTDPKGIATRIGYLISAFVYASLSIFALRLATNNASASNSQGQGGLERLFSLPLGRWLVAIAGLVVLVGGFYQLYKAYSTDFSEHMRWNEMSATERTWGVRLGRIGLAARGIVQCIVGIFLEQAAFYADPSKVQNSRGALDALARPPFGPWMVGIVALGLAAYGVYMLAAARYSRIVMNSGPSNAKK